MTKKYRCKISTPWMIKGEVYDYDDSKNHIIIDNRIISPENYPDLFEPVEEISNVEKWVKIFSYIYEKEKRYFELKSILDQSPIGSFNILINCDYSKILDSIGYNADKAYEYIVEGKK